MTERTSIHGQWSSRMIFILAATGSAVGLGNIWKFPYITGENGGGAFVLLYLGCVFAVGMPILVSEVLLGRRGRLQEVVEQHGSVEGSSVTRTHQWSSRAILPCARPSQGGAGGEMVDARYRNRLANLVYPERPACGGDDDLHGLDLLE